MKLCCQFQSFGIYRELNERDGEKKTSHKKIVCFDCNNLIIRIFIMHARGVYIQLSYVTIYIGGGKYICVCMG